MKKSVIYRIATILAGLGALNWLSVAFFDLNLVTLTLGDMTLPAKIVYGVMGISGLLLIVSVLMNKGPKCKD